MTLEYASQDLHDISETLSSDDAARTLSSLEAFFSNNLQAKSEDLSLESVTSNVGIAVQMIRAGAPIIKLSSPSKAFSHQTVIVRARSNVACIDLEGDTVIGCAVLENDRRSEDDIWQVGWIGTLPQFREMGINTERLRRIRLFAKEKGLTVESGRWFESEFARASWDRLVEEKLAIKIEGQGRYTFA